MGIFPEQNLKKYKKYIKMTALNLLNCALSLKRVPHGCILYPESGELYYDC